MKKTIKELNFSDDFMFGAVLKEPEICRKFLETILGMKISRVEFPERQKAIEPSYNGKSIRLDVYVADEKGTVYNIEMQVAESKNLPKRTRYYQGQIDAELLEKGRQYDELNDSFVIFICMFDPFEEGRCVYTFENRCLENPELSLADGTKKIFVNVNGTKGNASEELKNLLKYIAENKPNDEFTQELHNAVNGIKENDEWRRAFMKFQIILNEKHEEGRAEGRAEGRTEGRAENRKETVLNMLKENLPYDTIKRCAGVSDEELTTIMKSIQN